MAIDKCGDFTLTNTGVRSMNNATTGLTTKDCWGR
jgi:type IV pilus assembly protein PilE